MKPATAALVESYLAHLQAGYGCLHPTDTVPGLTFDPMQPTGLQAVLAAKGRAENKPFVCLIPQWRMALKYFVDLPPRWLGLLPKVWPGPLTIVWQANPKVPRLLTDENGFLALRVPKLAAGDLFYRDVLQRVDQPMPSTSVNAAGSPPATSWGDAVHFARQQDRIFIPEIAASSTAALPSSVIRLLPDGEFKLLRQGSFDVGPLA